MMQFDVYSTNVLYFLLIINVRITYQHRTDVFYFFCHFYLVFWHSSQRIINLSSHSLRFNLSRFPYNFLFLNLRFFLDVFMFIYSDISLLFYFNLSFKHFVSHPRSFLKQARLVSRAYYIFMIVFCYTLTILCFIINFKNNHSQTLSSNQQS